jgi:aspartyl-tRNA(Asn)/glutamyl-tRNA(Gln) amidotransferase subunit C
MSLTRDQVMKVAQLARLHLDEAEVAAMSPQLTAILDFFEQLSEIDTDGIEPMAHPLPMQNVFRDDERHQGLGPDDALANAPKRRGDFFSVPSILD